MSTNQTKIGARARPAVRSGSGLDARESRQLVKLLSKVRDTNHHKVGMVIAFLLQGNFVCDLDRNDLTKGLVGHLTKSSGAASRNRAAQTEKGLTQMAKSKLKTAACGRLERLVRPLESLLINQADIPKLIAREAEQERIRNLPKLTAIGQRVKFSALAVERKVWKPGTPATGTATGESKDGKILYVRRDGRLSKRAYATEYWELA